MSCALVGGMQLDGNWKLRKVFKLWFSGVGLCLVIWWHSEVELGSSEGGVELLWSGETH